MGRKLVILLVCLSLLPVSWTAAGEQAQATVDISIGGKQPIQDGLSFTVKITVQAAPGIPLTKAQVEFSFSLDDQCVHYEKRSSGTNVSVTFNDYSSVTFRSVDPAQGFTTASATYYFNVVNGANKNLVFTAKRATFWPVSSGGYRQTIEKNYTILLAGAQEAPHEHQAQAWQTVVEPGCETTGLMEGVCSCGESLTRLVEPLGHQPEWVLKKHAACLEDGEEALVCVRCEKAMGDMRVIPMKGHVWNEGEVVAAASCGQPGVLRFCCAACGEVKEEVISAAGHGEFRTEVTPATCSADGLERDVCTQCGEVVAERPIAAGGHQWDQGNTIVRPLCETPGLLRYTCFICGHAREDSIPATGHGEFQTVIQPPSCAQTGLEQQICGFCGLEASRQVLPETGHRYPDGWTWEGADCTLQRARWKACMVAECGHVLREEVAPFPAHDLIAEQVLATCTQEGLNISRCTRCDACKQVVVPALGHVFSLWMTSPLPTCVSAGLRTRTCSVCQLVQQETVEPTPNKHDFSNPWRLEVEPTCQSAGSCIRICTREGCGAVLRQQLPALAHQYPKEWTVPDGYNCQEGGDRFKVCSACGQAELRETLAPGAHAFTDWDVVRPADCVAPGLQVRRCTLCDHAEEQEIPVSHLHSNGPLQIVKDATCTQEGEMGHKCRVCGLWTSIIVMQKLPHSYSEWIRRPGGTCEEVRFDDRTCAVCSAVDTREIPAGQHTLSGRWEVVEPPGCLVNGLEKCSCLDCDYEAFQPIRHKGHTWSALILGAPSTCYQAGYRYQECRVCSERYIEELMLEKHRYTPWETLVQSSCLSEGLRSRRCQVPECGFIEEETLAQLPHQMSAWEEKAAPTCAAPGMRACSCVLCETVFTEELPKLAHPYGDYEVLVAAVCGKEGLEECRCPDCGDVQRRAIPQLFHVWTVWQPLLDAACEQEGKESRTCTLCGEQAHRALAAVGHRFGQWGGRVYKDCVTGGIQTRDCERCGAQETRPLKAVQHAFGAWQRGEVLDCLAEWTEFRTCGRCGWQDSRANRYKTHQFGNWVIEEAAACQVAGRRTRVCARCAISETQELAPLAHAYGRWAEQAPSSCATHGVQARVCKHCGHQEVREKALLAHQFGKWVNENLSDCLQPRQQTRTCQACDHQEQRDAPAYKVHEFSRWQPVQPASCGAPGQRQRQCERCGMVETGEIKQLAHAFGKWANEVTGDCTQAVSQTRICKVCDHQERRAAAGYKTHDFSRWQPVQPASCSAPGQRQRQCDRCGMVETGEIKQLAHAFSKWSNEAMEDCTQAVSQTRICKACDHQERREVAPYFAHHYTAWEEMVPSACGIPGQRQRHCSRCAQTETGEMKPLSHAFGPWSVREEPACERPGTQARACKHCGHEETKETKALAHQPGKWRITRKAALFRAGLKEKLCKRCGASVASKNYQAPKSSFAVRFCSLGLSLNDIRPGMGEEWYLLTPIDLTQQGTIRYPLIAAASHVVGEIQVEIMDGKLIIRHVLYDERTEIIEPSLRFFTSWNSITPKELAKTTHAVPFDKAIDLARSFPGKKQVILSVNCRGIYDRRSIKNPPYHDGGIGEDGVPYALTLEKMRELAGLW